jgi:2-dehydro-3-deoxyphosphooctonate aldolase (KDO 8-P synthase)
VIESEAMTLAIAETLAGVAQRLGLTLIFKASFDKANRSSDQSFRGLGMSKGLQILDKVRRETGLAVITDVHEAGQVDEVAAVVDVLQTPAFLARQTDFIAAVAASGKPVNIKKAQFMAPADMQQVVNKARNAARAAGHDPDAFLLCERGTSFGYNTLVSDMRGLAIMAETGCPVVFDATHSVQQPGGLGERSGGQREFVPLLARAGGGGRRRGVHGNPSRSRPGPVGRPQRRAARRFRGTVEAPDGDRRGGEAGWYKSGSAPFIPRRARPARRASSPHSSICPAYPRRGSGPPRR